MYLPNRCAWQGCDTKAILKQFNRFEFRVFFLLDWLPYKGKKSQSAQVFTHSWRENNWIHTFPRVLVLHEMQTTSFKFWTQVAESISYNNNLIIWI